MLDQVIPTNVKKREGYCWSPQSPAWMRWDAQIVILRSHQTVWCRSHGHRSTNLNVNKQLQFSSSCLFVCWQVAHIQKEQFKSSVIFSPFSRFALHKKNIFVFSAFFFFQTKSGAFYLFFSLPFCKLHLLWPLHCNAHLWLSEIDLLCSYLHENILSIKWISGVELYKIVYPDERAGVMWTWPTENKLSSCFIALGRGNNVIVQ